MGGEHLASLMVQEVTYTHDTGVKITVRWKTGQTVDVEGTVLGPFPPYDLDETCAAIALHARDAGQFGLLQAAQDWRRICEEDPEDERYLKRKYCNWAWD